MMKPGEEVALLADNYQKKKKASFQEKPRDHSAFDLSGDSDYFIRSTSDFETMKEQAQSQGDRDPRELHRRNMSTNTWLSGVSSLFHSFYDDKGRRRLKTAWGILFDKRHSTPTNVFLAICYVLVIAYSILIFVGPLILHVMDKDTWCQLTEDQMHMFGPHNQYDNEMERDLGSGDFVATAGQPYPNPDYDTDPCRYVRWPFLMFVTLEECDISRRLLAAVLLGGAIGYERRSADRPAGIRTMGLVSLGACCFTISSIMAFKSSTQTWDSSRVTAALPSGVGFLGGSLIWKGSVFVGDESVHQVHGLTTAASLWLSAAVGVGVGGGLYLVTIYVTTLVIMILRYGPRNYLSGDEDEEEGEEEDDGGEEEVDDDEGEKDDDGAPYVAGRDRQRMRDIMKTMPNATPNDKDKWRFSLFLPFADQRVVQLTPGFTPPTVAGTEDLSTSGQYQGSENEEEEKSPETISLLDRDDSREDNRDEFSQRDKEAHGMQGEGHTVTCWKYQSPTGRTLQSSILLQLSYRPAWQGIPEYTSTHRQRQMAKVWGCCCPANMQAELNREQVWERYTTKHIVDTEFRPVTIRGIGECQAIQVYLKPQYDVESDEEQAPLSFRMALNSHRKRMGAGWADSDSFPGRFDSPGDSLTTGTTEKSRRYIVISFAVPLETDGHDPPLLWKVSLPPPQSTELMLDTITVLDGKVDLNEPASHVYINGYQSWSYTGSVEKGTPQPKPALPDTFSRAFNFGGSEPHAPTRILPLQQDTTHCHPQSKRRVPPVRYKSDFFTCLSSERRGGDFGSQGPSLLCGWISQHEQFGVVTLDETLECISMHASNHAQVLVGQEGVTTDWSYCQLVSPCRYDEEPMARFIHTAAAYNQANPLQNGPLLTGWCSWYHYYENISAANLRSNFAKLAAMKGKVPTNVVVVDDGYMTAWGDWDSLKPNKFTDMKVVCRDIQSHGMRPGIWLAPFACDKHSKLARQHPDWIIRNDQGRPSNSSNCGKFFYGLDATNPHVRQYVFDCVRRAVKDWGFEVLKIDFLYASCLEGNGKYDMSITRAQAMHLALQTIRNAAGPDVFLIGCGCPVGSGIGYVDGMRVSADTGPTWYPELPLPWWDHSTLPALRAMLRNSMSRAPMGHRWWHNDPDCLLLGETTKLTNTEVMSAASVVAMTCGMLLLSDDLSKFSAERMGILTKIFPMTGVSAMVLDLHTAQNRGMPSTLLLWCTDQYNVREQFRRSDVFQRSLEDGDLNAEATHFGRRSSFQLSNPIPDRNERKRSCIHVAQGLGTWTVVSLSNWMDKTQLMRIPRHALEEWRGDTVDVGGNKAVTTTDAGYHVFSFWSSRYSWVSAAASTNQTKKSIQNVQNGGTELDPVDDNPLSHRLEPHETKIFHIRPVTPGSPQYIGSDLHFSCGHEVLEWDISSSNQNELTMRLQAEVHRVGHVFVFVPTVDTRQVQATVGGKKGRWSVVASVPTRVDNGSAHCCGRILRIFVEIAGNGADLDGVVQLQF